MPPAIPRATYRLQLTADFGFDDAAAIVPYLERLGISHVYTSPFLKARAGSTHGYDIIDHNTLSPEFGGEEGFARLSEAIARADMGLILDFVPNHMGVGRADNAWWLDVLEWGQKSPYARMFDIDWTLLPYRHQGGLLLPILGKSYGEALEAGEIRLRFDATEGSFSFWYFEHCLPVRPDRYSEIIKTVIAAATDADASAVQALRELAERYAKLGSPSRAEAPKLKTALASIGGAQRVINAGLSAYAPQADNPASLMSLNRLLERQHYRLAHWRVAISDINYRRFFDINDLAGIRVEDLPTFKLIHRKVSELIAAGKLHGLRLDHIDGLYDPAQYCARLHRLTATAKPSAVPGPFYTVVEKILAPDERMPKLPGVHGTTGYDALNLISRVLVDQKGFAQMVEEAKALVIKTSMASEFTVLAQLLARIAAGHWSTRDYTFSRLSAALELFVLHFPVYRTYISGNSVSDSDRKLIVGAIEAAREQWYGSDFAIFDFLRDVLTLDLIAPGRTGYSSARVKRFAAKMQQFTGPVTAKAVEDTAFYRYHRLLALNEVGNDPSLPALPVDDFHDIMQSRARHQRHSMTATATHDTKRGEDARARILALSEIAPDWTQAVQRWSALNARLIAPAKRRSPSRAHEYMLYQALIGVWPHRQITNDIVKRLTGYAVKGAREGKLETSWVNPNEDYEQKLVQFVEHLLDPAMSAEFLADFDRFARRTTLLGTLNGLSQLALKTTMPGVPDFYQGCELWDLSLVDPDNRRPVDFDARARMLSAGSNGVANNDAWMEGAPKLALTHKLLRLRKQWPEVFSEGRYQPVTTSGRDSDHIIAFARTAKDAALITVVGRHFGPLTDGGQQQPNLAALDATLKLDRYRVRHDVLNDVPISPNEVLPVSALFADMPVAVLHADLRSGA
jgi:(1->4)-alpha-D-glucan 1-alpha-D-glucosylmutase